MYIQWLYIILAHFWIWSVANIDIRHRLISSLWIDLIRMRRQSQNGLLVLTTIGPFSLLDTQFDMFYKIVHTIQDKPGWNCFENLIQVSFWIGMNNDAHFKFKLSSHFEFLWSHNCHFEAPATWACLVSLSWP